jgi:hypothetical protein
MGRIDIDGNLSALYRHERDLDRAQRMDDWLTELEDEVWQDGELFETAMRRASGSTTIDDAVTEYAQAIMAERIKAAEIARAEVDCD